MASGEDDLPPWLLALGVLVLGGAARADLAAPRGVGAR